MEWIIETEKKHLERETETLTERNRYRERDEERAKDSEKKRCRDRAEQRDGGRLRVIPAGRERDPVDE